MNLPRIAPCDIAVYVTITDNAVAYTVEQHTTYGYTILIDYDEQDNVAGYEILFMDLSNMVPVDLDVDE